MTHKNGRPIIGKLIKINNDGIKNKPYLERELAEYFFEASTDKPLSDWGAMIKCCRVLFSVVLAYNTRGVQKIKMLDSKLAP